MSSPKPTPKSFANSLAVSLKDCPSGLSSIRKSRTAIPKPTTTSSVPCVSNFAAVTAVLGNCLVPTFFIT